MVAGRGEKDGQVVADTMQPRYLRLMFDGSVSSNTSSGVCILYGAHRVEVDTPAERFTVAWQSFVFPAKVSRTAAELEAVSAGL